MRVMDDLDFSKPAGAPKPAAPSSAPIYLPAIARAFFESVGKEEAIAAGTVFFAENEKASRILLRRDKVYLLLDGQVGLAAKGRAFGAVKVGEIFGEMAAISDSPRSATALAKTPCRVIALDDRQFTAALQKKPEFALMMLGVMIQRLRGRSRGSPACPPQRAAARNPACSTRRPLPACRPGSATRRRCATSATRSSVAGQIGAFMYIVLEGRVPERRHLAALRHGRAAAHHRRRCQLE